MGRARKGVPLQFILLLLFVMLGTCHPLRLRAQGEKPRSAHACEQGARVRCWCQAPDEPIACDYTQHELTEFVVCLRYSVHRAG